MQDVIQSWLQFLKEGNGAFGGVILVIGVCYLLAGGRFGRAAYIITYALIGIAVGVCSGQSVGEDVIYAAVIGVVSVVICVASGKYAGALLAGGLGSVFAWWWLGSMQVPALTMYIALVLAFSAFGAAGATNDRGVSIAVTSLVGAILIVSGLIGLAHESRSMATQLRAMASIKIFYPLVLSIVTVCGIMLQMASAKSQDSGNVG